MRKNFKFVWIIIKSILIFLIIGAFSTATVKNVQKIVLIESFKQKGIYQESLSTDDVKMYLIESDEELPSYTTVEDDIIPGYSGDILISFEAIVHPFVNGIISYFAGGHAAVCLDDYEDFDISMSNELSLEATGLEGGQNLSKLFARNYWSTNDVYDEVIGLRVKMSEAQRKEVISLSGSLLGDPYNFSFLFDTTNKSYCSDLVSKIYSYVGVNLNKDDFTTSIYDLLVSSDTYISYYHCYDSKGVKHIYYLG